MERESQGRMGLRQDHRGVDRALPLTKQAIWFCLAWRLLIEHQHVLNSSITMSYAIACVNLLAYTRLLRLDRYFA